MKNLALLLIRVGTGATIAAHGYTKLFGGPGMSAPNWAGALGPNFDKAVKESGPEVFAEHLRDIGIPEPKAAAYAAGLAEFGGGLGLLLGFKTRAAALAVAFNMAVAIKKVHLKNGYYGEGGFELPGLLGLNALAIFLYGPGALAIDSIFCHSSKKDDEKTEED